LSPQAFDIDMTTLKSIIPFEDGRYFLTPGAKKLELSVSII
jgi:hypothetical protein